MEPGKRIEQILDFWFSEKDADGQAMARKLWYQSDPGFDQALPPVERSFFYLPYMHSENRTDQQKCIALFEAHGNTTSLDYAKRHAEIIERFGRFPHRNSILGRKSTKEELAFLKRPDSGF